MEGSRDQESGRYAAVKQYTLAQILGVWAAAAVPMGVLAWIVAPWLRDQLGGDEPLAQALLICITAGLVWQFVVVVVLAVFNTVLGEELLFRGLLLPRMRGVFGRGDFVANGALFAVYHLHTPWVIPTSLVDIFALAYPSRRFQSAWMGIVVHSAQKSSRL